MASPAPPPVTGASAARAASVGPGAARAAATHAEAVGARLPPLVVQAERVAMTVMQGVHGRRRSGQGDAFWQFRPFLPGDSASRVDWRQSARSDRLFIRETEWEAAQTVALWRDGSPSMQWRSTLATSEKSERADLLLLALAALLLRGGERVRLLNPNSRSLAGRSALERLAEALPRSAGPPEDPALPRHARVVLFGDFLAPLPEVAKMVGSLAARPVRGHLVQVMDPAEETLPFAGRVRFEGMEQEEPTIVPRVEGIRALYAERLAAHRDGLAAIASAAGWTFARHRTDHPPEAALLALHQVLAPE